MHKTPDHLLIEVRDFIAQPYAWPGGYPLVLYFADGDVCCAECAAENYDLIAADTRDDYRGGWCAAGVCAHLEGPPEYCASCGTPIESAYGDPDSDH